MIGIAGFAITDSGLTSHRPVAGILIADGKPMAAAKEREGVGNKPNRLNILFINNITQE